MAYYRFFTVEHFDNVSAMTFTEAAATRASEEGELRVELNEFASSVASTCVVVNFARLATRQSALIGVLVGLKKLLKGENRLHLCEMNSHLKDNLIDCTSIVCLLFTARRGCDCRV